MNGEGRDEEWHIEGRRWAACREQVAGQCGWVECRGPAGGSTYHERGSRNAWVVAGHVDGDRTHGWGRDV